MLLMTCSNRLKVLPRGLKLANFDYLLCQQSYSLVHSLFYVLQNTNFMITDSDILLKLNYPHPELCWRVVVSVHCIKIVLHAYALLIFFILDIHYRKYYTIKYVFWEKIYIWKIGQKTFRGKIKCQFLIPSVKYIYYTTLKYFIYYGKKSLI